jgi:hypothetical protein
MLLSIHLKEYLHRTRVVKDKEYVDKESYIFIRLIYLFLKQLFLIKYLHSRLHGFILNIGKCLLVKKSLDNQVNLVQVEILHGSIQECLVFNKRSRFLESLDEYQ